MTEFGRVGGRGPGGGVRRGRGGGGCGNGRVDFERADLRDAWELGAEIFMMDQG